MLLQETNYFLILEKYIDFCFHLGKVQSSKILVSLAKCSTTAQTEALEVKHFCSFSQQLLLQKVYQNNQATTILFEHELSSTQRNTSKLLNPQHLFDDQHCNTFRAEVRLWSVRPDFITMLIDRQMTTPLSFIFQISNCLDFFFNF